MWRRLMRRSMGPRRPVVFAEQIPLLIVTAVALVGGLAILFLLTD